MIRPRGKISWKENHIPTCAPPIYIPVPESSKQLEETWASYLKVGALWRLAHNMELRKNMASNTPYLMRDLYTGYPGKVSLIAKGALAVYAGAERCEELRKDSVLRVIRHAFIINGGKYIITDFINIEPVI